MPQYYKINGSIYVNLVSEINKDLSFNDNLIPYIMKAEHSVDIDDYLDVAVAQYYLNMYGEKAVN